MVHYLKVLGNERLPRLGSSNASEILHFYALIVDVLRSTFFKIYFLVFSKFNFKNLSEIKLQNIITIVIFNKCVKQDEIHTKRRFL